MPRSSPQTERLVDVLELLADTASAGRGLAEIARYLDVDKATCYPMLRELTRVGWLVRHPRRKTFHLGPRLISIGRAAETAIDVVDLAQPALTALAAQVGAPCLAVASSADELVVAAVVPPPGRGRRRALGLRAGDRIALCPPLGSVLVAWSEQAAVQRWIDRAQAVDPAGTHERYRHLLAVVRRRGFAVEVYPPSPMELGELLEALVGTERGTRRTAYLLADQLARLRDDVLVGEMRDAEMYWPISINAPVFDDGGNASLALCVVDLPGPLTGAEITQLGRQVHAAAAEVTGLAHGRPG